jgi:ABC-type dipeptide/oligopeptide/nickel transport system ATPase component
MLRILNINTFYGTSHILHGVSLEIEEGELVSVLGRNGAGKTTLLRSITGVNPPKSGTIELQGTDITHLKSHKRARIGISYVPQGRQIIPDVTVEENIRLALLGKGRKANGLLEVAYEYFPALKPIAGRSFCCWTNLPKAYSPQSWRRYRRSSNGFSASACAPFCSLSSVWISCARLRSASQFSIRDGS